MKFYEHHWQRRLIKDCTLAVGVAVRFIPGSFLPTAYPSQKQTGCNRKLSHFLHCRWVVLLCVACFYLSFVLKYVLVTIKEYQHRECRDIDRWSWMRFAVPIKYLRYELWLNIKTWWHQLLWSLSILHSLINRLLASYIHVVRLIHIRPPVAAVSANLTFARTALCSLSQWMVMFSVMLWLHQ